MVHGLDLEWNEFNTTDPAKIRNAVREFYDKLPESLIDALEGTFQYARVVGGAGCDGSTRASNLYLAKRAGITSGMRVLDAGCGIGGPCVDIASSIEGVRLDAVTISPKQAFAARKRLLAANVQDRVTVYVADYHSLPFGERSFDVVLFLESACYSYDRDRLFSEAFSVLKEGGTLYVKDWFLPNHQLSEREQAELDVFNSQYRSRPERSDATIERLRRLSFTKIETHDLTPMLDSRPFASALFNHGFRAWTETLSSSTALRPEGSILELLATRPGSSPASPPKSDASVRL